MATCIHRGTSTYHKPSGRSALHPNGSTIAVSNLFDGVDWYSISPQKHANSVKIPISDNLPTPLCYIHGGSALLVGGTSGKAHIIDCRSLNELQAMDHNGAAVLYVETLDNANHRDQTTGVYNQL